MKLIKFVLPVMLVAFAASAADDCRVYSPKANQGKLVDGTWVPDAPAAQN